MIVLYQKYRQYLNWFLFGVVFGLIGEPQTIYPVGENSSSLFFVLLYEKIYFDIKVKYLCFPEREKVKVKNKIKLEKVKKVFLEKS